MHGDDARDARGAARDDLLVADLHLLPSGALDGGPGGADAADARRALDARDRARVPGRGERPSRSGSCARRRRSRRRVPFAIPDGDELAPRLAGVLEVVYLIFNEGYAATAGDDWMRPGAVRGRAAARARARRRSAPREGEVWGLLALMEIQASRIARARRARRLAGPAARPGPLALGPAADPARPGGARPRRRARARRLRPAGRDRRLPRPRRRAPRTPTGSGSPRSTRRSPASRPRPVVELNRAVAIGMAFGPAAGLATSTSTWPTLGSYHLLPSVRGDLLERARPRATRRARSSSARRR